MPVFVDTSRCPCTTPCYPAKMCPKGVLTFDQDHRDQPATLDPAGCGDCKGPCTNFCDPRALRYAATLQEIQLIEAEVLGTMSADEIAAERKRVKEEQEKATQQQQQQQQSATVIDVTTATFEQEVLQELLPVVVDFWAPWCGPCKAFAPVFSQVAQEYVGRVKFCKVNTDAEQTIAQALRIQSIPTLIAFYQGQPLGAIPGAMSAAQLRSTLEQIIQMVVPPTHEEPDTSHTAPRTASTPHNRVVRGKEKKSTIL